ncbi:MAG TPA: LamG-like jellyroll fold domain-containing protein, partial [Candidatus Limnocylindria bacterium]|nr:LamG-like jellyroll fold domain-containing protein [Candidatus Limnocylindria bacterium]
MLWLPLDELGGTSTANLFGGGNNGTLINNPSHAGGFVANCLCFDGTSQYVDVPDYPAINPGVGDLSLDAWVKRDPTSGNGVRIIVDKRGVTAPYIGYSLSVSFGNLIMTLTDAIGQTNYRDTGVVPADNAWHFVAVTIHRTSTSGGTFYIDGNPTSTFDPTGRPGGLDNTSSFGVGRSPVDENSPWLGCIDEVEMFNRALTTAEIRSIFYAGPAGKCKCACPTAAYTHGAPATIYGDPFVLVATHTNPIPLFGLASDNFGRIHVGNNGNSAHNSGMPVQVHVPTPVPRPPTGFTDLGTTLMGDADGISCFGNLLYVADPAGVEQFTLPNSNPTLIFSGVAGNGAGSPLVATATALFVGHGAFIAGWIDEFQLPNGPLLNSYFPTASVETMAKDPDANVFYYAPYGPTVHKFTPPGSDSTLATLSGPIDGGLTFDPISHQVLAGTASGGELYSVDPNTGYLKLFANGFTSCSGLLREPLTGDLYVLEDHALWRLCSNFVSKVVSTLQVQCPTNKTVECGSVWTFDQPTATSGCTNLSITPIGATTNGVCPKILSQGWLISDGCGNSQTCTQQVTVVDTTPPVIKCKTRTVVVTLNSNCLLVIPRIQLSATDNCTPSSQLSYEQYPKPGAMVSGRSHVVTVTVTDACGNSNTCPVTVYGQEPAPRIRCPGAVTVTNCVVPDVTRFVPASGCSRLSYEQFPKAGTPMGPGINSVTVTVKNQSGGTATCVIALQFTGPTSFLDQLYNTGVDDNRAKLAENAIDPHYTLPNPPPGTIVTSPGKAVATSWPWFALPNSSSWIAPTRNFRPFNTQQPEDTTYTYVMNAFTLPPGADPTTASISGRWAADNAATMNLNGTQVASENGFASWKPFTISGPGLFNGYPVQNTLTFVVTNEILYTGLRVEMTNAFVNCSNCAPPSIVSMTGDRSLPPAGIATFKVIAGGTTLFHYYWYHNGQGPLMDSLHYSGTEGATLTVKGLGYGDGGIYTVVVSNACGVVSQTSKLTIVLGWPWPVGKWDFLDAANPMRATLGPDLVLSGSNTLGIASGTTLDFGLPNPLGQIPSVIYIPPLLPSDMAIQLPFIASPGSNTLSSYSLVMDIYSPSNSSGTVRTLFS